MPMKPRPTTATLILRFEASDFRLFMNNLRLQFAERSSGRKFFNQHASRANVRNPLVTGLAFDAQIAMERDLIERGEKRGPVHFAGAGDNFLAPRAGDFG